MKMTLLSGGYIFISTLQGRQPSVSCWYSVSKSSGSSLISTEGREYNSAVHIRIILFCIIIKTAVSCMRRNDQMSYRGSWGCAVITVLSPRKNCLLHRPSCIIRAATCQRNSSIQTRPLSVPKACAHTVKKRCQPRNLLSS